MMHNMAFQKSSTMLNFRIPIQEHSSIFKICFVGSKNPHFPKSYLVDGSYSLSKTVHDLAVLSCNYAYRQRWWVQSLASWEGSRREKTTSQLFPTKKQFRSRKASSKLAIGIVTPMEGEQSKYSSTASVFCNPNIMQKQIDSALHSGM